MSLLTNEHFYNTLATFTTEASTLTIATNSGSLSTGLAPFYQFWYSRNHRLHLNEEHSELSLCFVTDVPNSSIGTPLQPTLSPSALSKLVSHHFTSCANVSVPPQTSVTYIAVFLTNAYFIHISTSLPIDTSSLTVAYNIRLILSQYILVQRLICYKQVLFPVALHSDQWLLPGVVLQRFQQQLAERSPYLALGHMAHHARLLDQISMIHQATALNASPSKLLSKTEDRHHQQVPV